MSEKRINIRYKTQGKALVEGVSEEFYILKDLSVTGCQLECTGNAGIVNEKQYKLEIHPDSLSKIGAFDLLVVSKWIRAGDYSSAIGFSIVESPTGRYFERYVDYLAWRYSQGNSMTGNSAPETP